jgi:VWFA-related protein
MRRHPALRLALKAFLPALLAVAAPASSRAQRLEVLEVDSSKAPTMAATFELRHPSGELSDAVVETDLRLVEADRVVPGELRPSGAAEGAAWLFLVDTSGTMSQLLPDVRTALESFIDGLSGSDRAAILAFNDEVSVVHPFTADRGALRGNLEALQPGGRSTQLYLAVARAAGQLGAPGLPRRKLVVVVSDGKDEGTAYTLDDAIANARQAGASVLGLGITGGDPRYLLNLQRMAEKTGGLFLRVPPGARWEEKTALLARHARSRFTVTWASTLPTDGKAHSVRLEVAQESTAATATFDVVTSLVRPPWWRTRAAYGGAGALLLLLFGGAVALVRARRHRARVAELEGQIASERQKRAAVEEKIGQGLQDVKGKLEELERQPTSAPAPAPVPVAVEPPQKRRTVFVSGGPPPAVSYRSAHLELLNGPLQGSRLALLEGRTSLGRDETNRIVVQDEKASSQHAVILGQAGRFCLEDVGSTNGTFVDEQRLEGPHALRSGERVRLGGTAFLFRGEA